MEGRWFPVTLTGTGLSGCSSVGRVGGLGPSGRTFESCHPDIFFAPVV